MFTKNNSNDQFKNDVLEWACCTDGEKRNSYLILVEEPELKAASRSPKPRRVTNTAFIWLRTRTVMGYFDYFNAVS
jgi:hypothetical protein